MDKFVVTNKNNLELIICNLEGIWENQRDDNALNNMEDIDIAEGILKVAYDTFNKSVEIDLKSFPNFGGWFVEAAIENAMEDEEWENA